MFYNMYKAVNTLKPVEIIRSLFHIVNQLFLPGSPSGTQAGSGCCGLGAGLHKPATATSGARDSGELIRLIIHPILFMHNGSDMDR